jgi:3-oxoacyl-[acyl-carrier protein] reductase
MFADQVVLVTGASRGIGAATALAFARDGARVVLSYRSDEAGAQRTLAEIEAAGGQAAALRADISQPADAARYINGAAIPVDGALGAREAGPVLNGSPPR